MYFGEVASDARDQFLLQQMHALAIAIYQARQRNDKVDTQALLNRFKLLADEFRSRGGDLTPFDNFVNAVGTWIATSVDAIPQAIAALPVAVGKGLIQAVIPYAILAVAFLVFKQQLRK
jgi:hypothetical protein